MMVRPTQFGGARELFDFMKFLVRPLFLPQICPSFNIFFAFLSTPTLLELFEITKTLSNPAADLNKVCVQTGAV